MKFLVVGLGSMGKRRIRCLRALGWSEVVGFDVRNGRREESKRLYDIQTIDHIGSDELRNFDAIIISTPPDKHVEYLMMALQSERPAFVEASVTLDNLEVAASTANTKGVLVAPSCTMRFHPAIRDIKRIVQSGEFGRFVNFSYHFGQYLPDWHPWEKVTDFYVSKKETGAARELLPFELTWMVDILGFPVEMKGFFGKTMDVGAEIDDTYALALNFGGAYGILMIDAVSRYAIRKLTLNMEYGQIQWKWDHPTVELYDARGGRWIQYHQKLGQAHTGYNKNIAEDMYVDELSEFIRAVQQKGVFPNTLEDDIRILKLLYGFEQNSRA